jgi:protein TonB
MMGSMGAWAQATEPSGAPTQDSATAAPQPGSKEKPVIVSSGVIAALLLHKVDPVYPEDARKAKVSGPVVMLVIIDDEGKIAKLSAVAGPAQLRDAALDAVNQWRYKPYLLNGKPVFVKSQITVNFNIAH